MVRSGCCRVSLSGAFTAPQLSWDDRPSRPEMEKAWTTDRMAANGTNERMFATKVGQEGGGNLKQTKAKLARFYGCTSDRPVVVRWYTIVGD